MTFREHLKIAGLTALTIGTIISGGVTGRKFNEYRQVEKRLDAPPIISPALSPELYKLYINKCEWAGATLAGLGLTIASAYHFRRRNKEDKDNDFYEHLPKDSELM